MQYECKYCGSTNLYIEEKGNNTGLYCGDCGKWIKWLSKEEVRLYKHNENDEDKANDIEVKLKKLISEIESDIEIKSKQYNDYNVLDTRKQHYFTYCLALTKIKCQLENILNGNQFSYSKQKKGIR